MTSLVSLKATGRRYTRAPINDHFYGEPPFLPKLGINSIKQTMHSMLKRGRHCPVSPEWFPKGAQKLRKRIHDRWRTAFEERDCRETFLSSFLVFFSFHLSCRFSCLVLSAITVSAGRAQTMPLLPEVVGSRQNDKFIISGYQLAILFSFLLFIFSS